MRYSKTLRLKQDNAGCYQRMEVTNMKYSPEINFINTVGSRRINECCITKEKNIHFVISTSDMAHFHYIT